MHSNHPQFTAPNPEIETRIQRMLDGLSLEEKIQLIGGVPGDYRAYGGNTFRNERAGIPALRFADGPLGVHWWCKTSTAYPATIALAAAWDRELAYRYGTAIGRDARARGVHVLLGPGVNLYRSPLCGRNFEYLGEDPYLAAQLVAGYIRGCQDQGVCATVKHFAVNFQEYSRNHVSSDVDERTLHEMYLPAFRAAVQEAGVGAVMTAYNPVNTVHASEHRELIRDVLKEAWGFDGLVMSDWVSLYSAVNAANAGMDLEMPHARWLTLDRLQQPVRDGLVPEAVIDDKVRRLLRLMACFGWLEREQQDGSIPLEDETSARVAREVATAGCVLLRNEGLLPLDEHAPGMVAVIGPSALATPITGGGSAITPPWRSTGILAATQELLGPERVRYAVGAAERHKAAYGNSVYFTPVGEPGLLADYYDNPDLAGEPKARAIEQYLNHYWEDRPIGGGAVTPYSFSIRWTGVIRPEVSGTHLVYLQIWDGKYKVQVGDRVLLADESGDEFGVKVARIELEAGAACPVLVEYRSVRYCNNMIRVGWEPYAAVQAERDDAVRLAADADAVILCAGFNPDLESESFDRPFTMPYEQDELIRAVAAVNPRTAVVLTAGGNLEMTRWIDRVPAVLLAWYPGQEGGYAVADLLFGRATPGGKLPATFEAHWEDRSSYTCYHDDDGDKRVALTDGVFGGYRHHDRTGVAPLFPFGHGLSFTTFAYENLRISSERLRPGETLLAQFDLVNTGDREGAEVAQLYVSDEEASVPRPARELKGFVKVHLQPGERRTMEIPIEERHLQFYDPLAHVWTAEPGRFTVRIGASAADIRLTGAFEYTAE